MPGSGLVGGERGGDVAVAEQLDARAGAPHLVDELVVARAVEDGDGQVLDVDALRLGERAAGCRSGCGRGRSRPALRPARRSCPCTCRGRGEGAVLGDRDHRERVVAAGGADGGALERVERDVDLAGPGGHRRARRRRASASRRRCPRRSRPCRRSAMASKAFRIASMAAMSAAASSPRPMRRAEASAAASVTRTTSMARLRSMVSVGAGARAAGAPRG